MILGKRIYLFVLSHAPFINFNRRKIKKVQKPLTLEEGIMKKLTSLFLVLFLSAFSANAYYHLTCHATKQSDGTWQIHFPVNLYQADPNAPFTPEGKADDMAHKLITRGSQVTVCAAVWDYQNNTWVRISQDNHALTTTTDWDLGDAVGVFKPANVLPANWTMSKLRVWCFAAAGETPATDGCLFVNNGDKLHNLPPDPATVLVNGKPAYEIVLNNSTGDSKPASGK
jgi:hypothetical protein